MSTPNPTPAKPKHDDYCSEWCNHCTVCGTGTLQGSLCSDHQVETTRVGSATNPLISPIAAIASSTVLSVADAWHVVSKLTEAGYSIVPGGIEGHAPAGTRNGLNACACGTAFSSTWEEHVSCEIRRAAERSTMVDTCEHCGDFVITHDGQNWAHYRGPGRRLNRCQHTVPYGFDASPAHGGEYDFLTRTAAAEGENR